MSEAVLERKDELVDRLLGFAREQEFQTSEWFTKLREEALEAFAESGFPSKKEEAWRFTDLAPLRELALVPAPAVADAAAEAVLAENRFADLTDARIVFVNGRFSPDLSRLPQWEGLHVTTLREAAQQEASPVAKYLNQVAEPEESSFRTLNLALMEDGLFIQVDRGTVHEESLQVVFLTVNEGSDPVMVHPRVVVAAEDNAQIRLVETHLGPSSGVYFSNPVTELVAGTNAVIEWYKLQEESPEAFHIGSVESSQGRDANVSTGVFSLRGRLIRNDIGSTLNGSGGWVGMDGLFLVEEDHHVDNFTKIHHAEPHCDSRELFKGILSEKARAVFRGRIIVKKGAQKTDSKQTNRNLLLSDEALVNTKPQLEIYADDVKCTHGATIGQLDADALFYLRARGIDRSAAKSMLIYAFAREVVSRIKSVELRDALDAYLFDWLPQGDAVQALAERE